jgi:hypothetical protein
MNVFQECDRVVLEVGTERREVLLSLGVATYCANALDYYAGKAAVRQERNPHSYEPTLTVELILNGRKPNVRLRLDRWATRVLISAAYAVELAKALRAVVREGEKRLAWAEESDPAVLLT